MTNNKTKIQDYIKLNTFPFHIELWHPENPIPLHYHDCVELLLTKSGSALCHVGDIRLKFNKGDLFVISGDSSHTIHDAKDFYAYRILFDFSLLDRLDDNIKRTPGYITLFSLSGFGCDKFGYRSCLHVKDFYFDRISALLNDMIYEYENISGMTELYLQECFNMFVTLLLKTYDDRIRTKKHTPAEILPTFIQDHLNEKISVSDVAKHIGVSEQYCRRLFKEHWGLSPMQFITDLRMRKAKALLALDTAPITQIAMVCGFCDSSHFSNAFYKIEGITPSEYRKQNKKAE